MRPIPNPLPHGRLRGVLASAALALAASAPSAQAQAQLQAPGTAQAVQGLLPGNWTLSESPDTDPDSVVAQCRQGMIVAVEGGRWFGMVALPDADPPQITVDGRATCDEGPKGALCTVALTPVEGEPSQQRFFMEFDIDDQDRYWMRIHFLGTDESTVYYPQRCPAEALQELVNATFAPAR
jgi:hypothetical protein